MKSDVDGLKSENKELKEKVSFISVCRAYFGFIIKFVAKIKTFDVNPIAWAKI